MGLCWNTDTLFNFKVVELPKNQNLHLSLSKAADKNRKNIFFSLRNSKLHGNFWNFARVFQLFQHFTIRRCFISKFQEEKNLFLMYFFTSNSSKCENILSSLLLLLFFTFTRATIHTLIFVAQNTCYPQTTSWKNAKIVYSNAMGSTKMPRLITQMQWVLSTICKQPEVSVSSSHYIVKLSFCLLSA